MNFGRFERKTSHMTKERCRLNFENTIPWPFIRFPKNFIYLYQKKSFNKVFREIILFLLLFTNRISRSCAKLYWRTSFRHSIFNFSKNNICSCSSYEYFRTPSNDFIFRDHKSFFFLIMHSFISSNSTKNLRDDALQLISLNSYFLCFIRILWISKAISFEEFVEKIWRNTLVSLK